MIGMSLSLAVCAPKVQKFGAVEPNPAAAPGLTAAGLVATDGQRLPVKKWNGDGPVTAVIIALHGFNDYRMAFDAPATWWARHGITTYAYDQRGFGDTAGRGIWAGTEALKSDLRLMVSSVRRQHPDARVLVLGESMGGAVAMAALCDGEGGRLPVDGVILAAPAVWGWSSMNPLYRVALWLSAHTIPWKRVTGGSLEITPSDNIEMLRALGRDPLVIKKTRIDAVYGLTGLMERAYRNASKLNVPILLLYGRHDEIIPAEPIHKVAERLNGASRTIIYENGYHMLLRDLQAEVVWRDILEWIGGDR